MRTSQIGLVAVVLAVLAVLAIYLSGNRNPANITMCGTGKSGTGYLLYAYGTEKGIFEEHGLNVSFVTFRDVFTMMLSFFSGKVTTTSMSLGLAGMSLDSGEAFRIGMAVGTSSDHVLLAQEGIEGIEQLRGKVLGVHGRTSDNYNIMKWYLESKGIDIESDMEVVEISSPSSLITSFQTGQIDAVVLWGAYGVKLEEFGGVPLVRAQEAFQEMVGHPYIIPTLAFTEKSLEDGEAVNAFLRAIKEVLREIEKDKEEAARIWSESSGESYEIILRVLNLYHLTGDLEPETREAIMAYFDFGVQNGQFQTIPGDEIFYASWE